jgi:hypothetical protein
MMEQQRERIQIFASTTQTKLKEKEGELKTKMQGLKENASSTRGEVKEKIGDMRKEIEARKQEMQSSIEQKKIDILKGMTERTIKRYEEALARLEKVAVRIESRIVKMDAEKLDTTKAKADMVIARQKIADAKTALYDMKTTLGTVSMGITATTDTTKRGGVISQGVQKMKEQSKKMNEAVKAAHKALVVVNTDIKAAYPQKAHTATTTSEQAD